MVYDFTMMQRDLNELLADFSFLQAQVIGRSVNDRPLYALRLGKGAKLVSYNGSHHGQEWLTTPLLLQFARQYAAAYANGSSIRGYPVKELFDTVTIWIVPMVNPDGVEIGKTVAGWQANANGVDINHNYDANWAEGKAYIAQRGITGPGPTQWSGPYPVSEPETKAMVTFTNSRIFEYVIALHSQGEVIYWQFEDKTPPTARPLAEHFSKVSGYALDETTGTAAFSGYKDWFIDKHHRPGFTVEVGLGTNPLPWSQFDPIYEQILEILLPTEV